MNLVTADKASTRLGGRMGMTPPLPSPALYHMISVTPSYAPDCIKMHVLTIHSVNIH